MSSRQPALRFATPRRREEFAYSYEPIHVNQSTFKAGLADEIHRWFRLTPSFGPDLVEDMLETMSTSSADVVLDPFCGAATTVIECQMGGIAGAGIEINPLLQFVGATSLNWSHDPSRLAAALCEIRETYLHNRTNNRFDPPPIYDPFRWWRRDVLQELLALRHAIDGIEQIEISQFFRLALAGVLVPDLTNVTLGRLQLHFIDRSNDTIDVWRTFELHAMRMIHDIQEVTSSGVPTRQGKVVLGDSTNETSYAGLGSFSRVITSPPYPNRYSYVWNTRPHLYLLGFFSNAKQASLLDLTTVGGTWGSATSVLMRGDVSPANEAVRDVIEPTASAIRGLDRLMANYLVKYFNLLSQQIVAMDSSLKPGARVAYVVGCSRLKGVYVETDTLLARLFEHLDLQYRVDGIHRFRKRHSGVDLFESIVYASKI
jgi:hypothetical protein